MLSDEVTKPVRQTVDISPLTTFLRKLCTIREAIICKLITLVPKQFDFRKEISMEYKP
jgi:hypothetical protein